MPLPGGDELTPKGRSLGEWLNEGDEARRQVADLKSEVELLEEALLWALWHLPTPGMGSDPEYAKRYREADDLAQPRATLEPQEVE